MEIQIDTIKNCPQFLEEIIQLGDANSKTLGFLPHEAFRQAARNNKILLAYHENELAGYLLYRISKGRASITHFCIASLFHGKKISDKLFAELIECTKPICKGVRLNCRRDYEYANKLWERLGFIPINEKKGRDKRRENILTIWWYDYHKQNLFTLTDSFVNDNLIGVLDVNVFSDLEKQDENFQESLVLNSDWIANDIELCVVDEIYNELNREKDALKRKKTKNFISHFKRLPYNRKKFNNIFEQLSRFLPTSPSENTISDFKQLGMAITAGADFFITRDRKILNITEKIENDFGLRILSPAAVILEIDEVVSKQKYEPRRLAGTSINKFAVNSKLINKVTKELYASRKGEKRKILEEKINKLIANVKNTKIETVIDDNTCIALIGSFGSNKKLEVPLVRVQNTHLSWTLSKQIITEIIQKAINEKLNIIEISDQYLNDNLINALEEARFIKIGNKWIKVLISEIVSYKKLRNRLNDILSLTPEIKEYLEKTLKQLEDKEPRQEQLYELERTLHPIKIIELDIPNFSIPIHSNWAKNLFDIGLANQELFGAKEKLVFNRENVYYSSAKNKNILRFPARILWYVTNDIKLKGTKSIRAISYLENFEVGLPKELFKKYKNLGIYEWRDISNLIKGDISKEILAFRFRDTELINPIPLNKFETIYVKHHEKNLFLQPPVLIKTKSFLELYELGKE